MEWVRAFAPLLIFIAIMGVFVWVALAWYFGFSWA